MRQSANSSRFDIDEKLNEIIFKYHLDDVYPDYKKMLQAEKLADELTKSWIGNGKIACIVTYESDIHRWKHFLRYGQEVEFIRCSRKTGVRDSSRVYDTEEKLGQKKWEEYSGVYVLSMEGSFFIRHWLRTHGVSYVFLYDYFASQGLFFSKDWDTLLTENSTEAWAAAYWHKPKRNFLFFEILTATEEWRCNTEPALKELNWKRAFFLSLYIRDFCLADKLVRNCPSDYGVAKKAWKEISNLIKDIRKEIKKCSKRHILLLWTDAVPYEDIDKIPFLANKMDTGICFDNMFTVNGNTNPTLKALFCHKMPVAGDSYSIKKISAENSGVYKELERHDYNITMLGGYWDSILPANKSDRYFQRFSPVSLMLWDLWKNMIQAEKPCFWAVHEILESHFPFLSANLTDEVFRSDGKRFFAACDYIDKQYHFYLDELPQCMVKIYMTDHGQEEYCKRYHTFFLVENGEKPCHVDGMCSYYDFDIIIKRILNGESLTDKVLTRKYVLIQDLDLYSPEANAAFIKHCLPGRITTVGYHGIIDKKYIYIKFNNGIEWMAERGKAGPEPNLFSERIDAPGQLDKYRKWLGDIPEPSPTIKKKLRYARYLQKAYENARPRNLEKHHMLNEWIRKYPKGSLAIRTGGFNALGFYDLLTPDNQERIACFVDRDSACKAAQRGKRVLSDFDAVPSDIKGIVLVSYKFFSEIEKEIERYTGVMEILNPFEYLKTKGLVCKAGVAEYELTKEDYDVGFPFDEIDGEI